MPADDLPPDAQALWDKHRFPRLDCGDIPQSDEKLAWRLEQFGNPQRVVSVAARERDRIAIVRAKPEPHYWGLPGGSVRFGETLEVAAVRETMEKCALEVVLLKPLASTTARLVAPGASMNWTDVLFGAWVSWGSLTVAAVAAIDDARWASAEELEGLLAQRQLALSWQSFTPTSGEATVDRQLLDVLRGFAAEGTRG